ncbi:hypothetical protein AGMMS49974_11520 [Deltaproteobacteria bacterium]|nr:hypothetical protein AGMMS49974_11520 [Deltaproteobacteria bacterium]
MVKIAAISAGNNGDSFRDVDGGFLLVPFLTSISQLPVYLPPALAWMALRFEDITLYAFA